MQELIKFCKTQRQVEILEAVLHNGSNRAAAKALGCNVTSTGWSEQ